MARINHHCTLIYMCDLMRILLKHNRKLCTLFQLFLFALNPNLAISTSLYFECILAMLTIKYLHHRDIESNRLCLKEFRLDCFIGSFPYIPGSNFSFIAYNFAKKVVYKHKNNRLRI